MYNRTLPVVLSGVVAAAIIGFGSTPASAASRISFSQLVPATASNTINPAAVGNACQTPDSNAHISEAYTDQSLKLASVQDSHANTQIQLELDSVGNLMNASIVKSSGNTYFDQQALAAARASKYAPEVRNCNSFKRTYFLNIGLDNSVVWIPTGFGGEARPLVR